MNIVLNGKNCPVGDPSAISHLTYEDVVQMAGYDPKRIYSVVYSTRRKGDEQRQGSLIPGKAVRIEDGMRFDVADTSNA